MVICVPPEEAVYHPLKVYPVRVGFVGRALIVPPLAVDVEPPLGVLPPCES